MKKIIILFLGALFISIGGFIIFTQGNAKLDTNKTTTPIEESKSSVNLELNEINIENSQNKEEEVKNDISKDISNDSNRKQSESDLKIKSDNKTNTKTNNKTNKNTSNKTNTNKEETSSNKIVEQKEDTLTNNVSKQKNICNNTNSKWLTYLENYKKSNPTYVIFNTKSEAVSYGEYAKNDFGYAYERNDPAITYEDEECKKEIWYVRLSIPQKTCVDSSGNYNQQLWLKATSKNDLVDVYDYLRYKGYDCGSKKWYK